MFFISCQRQLDGNNSFNFEFKKITRVCDLFMFGLALPPYRHRIKVWKFAEICWKWFDSTPECERGSLWVFWPFPRWVGIIWDPLWFSKRNTDGHWASKSPACSLHLLVSLAIYQQEKRDIFKQRKRTTKLIQVYCLKSCPPGVWLLLKFAHPSCVCFVRWRIPTLQKRHRMKLLDTLFHIMKYQTEVIDEVGMVTASLKVLSLVPALLPKSVCPSSFHPVADGCSIQFHGYDVMRAGIGHRTRQCCSSELYHYRKAF